MTFWGKMSIFTSKISDDLFLSHGPCIVCLLPVSTVNLILFNNIIEVSRQEKGHYYMPLFLPRNLYFRIKHSFVTLSFSHFVLYHASNNTTSRNIGGTNAWASLPPQILGDRPPSPPKSPPMHGMWYTFLSSQRLESFRIDHCVLHRR